MADSSNIIPEGIKSLIIKFLTEQLNDGDVRKLNRWIGESTYNRQYFNSIREMWIISGKLEPSSVNDTGASFARLKDKLAVQPEKIPMKTRFFISKWYNVAAAGLLFFILGGTTMWFAGKKNNQVAIAEVGTNEIICPYGSKTNVFLPDGSEVLLNAGSSLKYKNDFNSIDRKISLTGEGFFNVTSDKNRPFMVIADRIIVKAYGTKFNVKSYPEESTESAILVEGSIDIEVLGHGSKSETYRLKPNEKIEIWGENAKVLNINDQKTTRQEQRLINPLKVDISTNVKTELFTSWKDERWIIEKEPLEALVTMLERRYNLKFRFVDNDLRRYRFTGTIRNETIDQILEALMMTAPLKYSINKDSVILALDKEQIDKYKTLTTKK